MRRLLVVLLAGGLIAAGLAASGFAQEKKAPAAAKQTEEFQWNGTITRMNLDKKALEVKHHTQSVTRTVLYTDKTAWTKENKAIGIPKLTEGMHIIARGALNDKGQVEATRIELAAQ